MSICVCYIGHVLSNDFLSLGIQVAVGIVIYGFLSILFVKKKRKIFN